MQRRKEMAAVGIVAAISGIGFFLAFHPFSGPSIGFQTVVPIEGMCSRLTGTFGGTFTFLGCST